MTEDESHRLLSQVYDASESGVLNFLGYCFELICLDKWHI